MDLAKIAGEAAAPGPQQARPIIMIGSGGIVHDAHLPAYAKANFPVAALVDVNLEKATKLANEFKIPAVFRPLAKPFGSRRPIQCSTLPLPQKCFLPFSSSCPMALPC